MTNESVQACQMEAESNALLYWSRGETKAVVEQLRLMSNSSARMVYTKLKCILPPTVRLHQYYTKYESGLLQLTTSLMNSTDDIYEDATPYASDLHKLNFGPNRKLDVSRSKTYF